MTQSDAIVFDQPRALGMRRLALAARRAGDVAVQIEASGISTGTERLLWTGEMPPFPGMGYPLVPGYEAVGRVVEAEDARRLKVGDRVFVPGSNGFADARGLFGASASHVQLPEGRLVPVADDLGNDAVLLALAATAHHAVRASGRDLPELIVGHGALGRLAARLTVALGGQPVVWETAPARQAGAIGYAVIAPKDEDRTDYRQILDVSGDSTILDRLVPHLGRGGEIVLAGFYKTPVSFAFPPAFMREVRMKIAAEWRPEDMEAVCALLAGGHLSLAGLLTHASRPNTAEAAYRTAFEDADCLKMVLDWRAL
ncbi:chlorophyll synthesis pathway protein BchC [Jiella sp. MQZ9-1]|uniref:Chlorophyll synthesis pathway protein BchC n=1 Tax=Jiella flava TaxID=2816857 RepID=A0A939JVY5_9HYPH|nr:chlorophyll synthesis pathway protein BchC [Jiella flava]MBO0661746.1 chlorophyll synthesis pathway protein BchC [Jiella flava]MCD2470387.1 chlorophyll synthesis pathway protein BchC [Jiella flava]